MTKTTINALIDCTSKIKETTPTEKQIKEMLSFLSGMDWLAEICNSEGPSGLRLEVRSLPEKTGYEKAFKQGICMWLDGADIEEASDYVAGKYFEEAPAGYDAAIYFAAVFSIGNILRGELSYSFIDNGLQYLLPDGWRWAEENKKEEEAHKDDKDWFPILHDCRKEFLGECKDEVEHRFDDVKICDLLDKKDPTSEAIGKEIAEMLPKYKDGALQVILKELTYTDLEKALYVLPEEAENRIMSNLSSYCIPIIKGDCILNMNSVSSIDIRLAAIKLKNAI
ncbi:MAG: hypothetical protein K5870_11950, partial [Lachnospiraceae bacterium]|nr:hypothetical protein [Lachnospiraceae bacterium]